MQTSTRKSVAGASQESVGPERCDLYQDRKFQLVSQRDRKRRLLDTVVCGNCGLVSHARIRTDDELAAYYQREYRLEYHSEFTPSRQTNSRSILNRYFSQS